MGVMSCNRIGCRGIMCYRHSDRFGYICHSCFEELIQSKLTIPEFMKSEKKHPKDAEHWERQCNDEFEVT